MKRSYETPEIVVVSVAVEEEILTSGFTSVIPVPAQSEEDR